MRLKMISQRLLTLFCLFGLAGFSQVRCAVDESKPDLSMFRLRSVHSAQQTQDKLTQPIKDYGSGAMMMRKSLFASDSLVRCSAYAHLLKLISQANPVGASRAGKAVKQDTVNALAIAVDNDRELYGSLFKMFKPALMLESFTQAIEQLEWMHVATALAKDTWLELIDCAVEFELPLESFLSMPGRASKIEKYREFKGKRGAEIESDKSRAKVFTEEEIGEARANVESFDDADLKEMRHVLRQAEDEEQVDKRSMPEINLEGAKDAPGQQELQIDVERPEVEETQAKFDVVDTKVIVEYVNVLNFLRHRVEILDSIPKERVKRRTKLSIESVVDYLNTWNRLQRLNLDPKDKLATRVALYLRDKWNLSLYRRMRKIAHTFQQITEYMIKIQNKNGRYESMDELEQLYGGVIKALSEVDQLIDSYDMTQAILRSHASQLREYQTINKFIENDHW